MSIETIRTSVSVTFANVEVVTRESNRVLSFEEAFGLVRRIVSDSQQRRGPVRDISIKYLAD